MQKLEESVIDAFCEQVKAIAKAADMAADESIPIANVYEAVESCMKLDSGVACMRNLYEAILASAVQARGSDRLIRNRREDVAQVYFIRRDDGLIKIGYSANPESRLSQLRQQHQCGMQILATVVGARQKEKELHERFSKHRITGEWFSPTPDLLEFIDSIRCNGTSRDEGKTSLFIH